MVLERIFFKRLPDVWSVLGACIIIGGAVRVALERKQSIEGSSVPDGYDALAVSEEGGAASDGPRAAEGKQ